MMFLKLFHALAILSCSLPSLFLFVYIPGSFSFLYIKLFLNYDFYVRFSHRNSLYCSNCSSFEVVHNIYSVMFPLVISLSFVILMSHPKCAEDTISKYAIICKVANLVSYDVTFSICGDLQV